MLNDSSDSTRKNPPRLYDTTPPTPLRTVDRAQPTREATPEALNVLRALVNDDSQSDMPAPHLGPRFSQRRAARLLLAGRSYQALQAWLNGDPIPKATADYLLEDLRRVDARAEDRVLHLAEDEIAIVVASGSTVARPAPLHRLYQVAFDRDTGLRKGEPVPTDERMTLDEFAELMRREPERYAHWEEIPTTRDQYGEPLPSVLRPLRMVWVD